MDTDVHKEEYLAPCLAYNLKWFYQFFYLLLYRCYTMSKEQVISLQT